MTHLRTSPYYPQSNGKIERWHRIRKEECIRPGTPLTVEDARRIVGKFVEHYNAVRLHSALGYVSPQDKFDVCSGLDADGEQTRGLRAGGVRGGSKAAIPGVEGGQGDAFLGTEGRGEWRAAAKRARRSTQAWRTAARE